MRTVSNARRPADLVAANGAADSDPIRVALVSLASLLAEAYVAREIAAANDNRAARGEA